MFGSELVHFFVRLVFFGIDILDFLIILGLDILNCSDFSNNAFFLLAFALQFGDLLLQWLELFIVTIDFLSQNFCFFVQDCDLIVIFAQLCLDFDVRPEN
jgi:hypothetical protein